jgi:thiazole synthase ThiGH ThiG subunit
VSDREFCLKALAGDRVRELGRVSWPVVLDAGVWAAGRAYAKGDAVTYGGSLWICQQASATARPETAEGARAWRLAVKRGRDGRGDRV